MEYKRIKEIIDMLMGYFQFKSENHETAQKGIKLLNELNQLVIEDFEIVYKRKAEVEKSNV